MSPDCPFARSEGLSTEELDGELLVYDSDSNLAHALQAEAAALWRACDGHTDTLAARCASSNDNVRVTLARLGDLGLLEDTQADEGGDTRRDALRKFTLAGAGLAMAPTISTILVPTASELRASHQSRALALRSPGKQLRPPHPWPDCTVVA